MRDNIRPAFRVYNNQPSTLRDKRDVLALEICDKRFPAICSGDGIPDDRCDKGEVVRERVGHRIFRAFRHCGVTNDGLGFVLPRFRLTDS